VPDGGPTQPWQRLRINERGSSAVLTSGPTLDVGDPECKGVVEALSLSGRQTRPRNDVTLHDRKRELVANASRKSHWFDCRVGCQGAPGTRVKALGRMY